MSIKYWHNCVLIEGWQIANTSPLIIIGNPRRWES